jgi:L-threonylcarbamoyladenylate synthase
VAAVKSLLWQRFLNLEPKSYRLKHRRCSTGRCGEQWICCGQEKWSPCRTETVYGLAANALEAKAIAKIFAIKGRPAHNPIIAHVADMHMARRCAAAWPDLADKTGRLVLAWTPDDGSPTRAEASPTSDSWRSYRRYPYGPLSPVHSSGHSEVWLSNCRSQCQTSPNRVSPTNASHVLSQLGDRVALIVDGGQCQVGIESTVVDMSECRAAPAAARYDPPPRPSSPPLAN